MKPNPMQPKAHLQRILERLNVSHRVLSAFARRHRLKRMSLFGSVTREDFRPDSDVDVLVEFAGPRTNPFARLDIADELSALFGGRDVDVVTTGVLRNPVRRGTIERDLLNVYVDGTKEGPLKRANPRAPG